MNKSLKSFSSVDHSPGRKGLDVLVGREVYLNAGRGVSKERDSMRGKKSDDVL